ncbi:MAG: hypothetical protein P1S60_04100 [Anaerolineae bacterium]|nr:hypothetical protein [Anaerolineae bacterium]
MEQKRKHYCKPAVEAVSLVPDEAVLGGCKMTSGALGIGQTGDCNLASCVGNATS